MGSREMQNAALVTREAHQALLDLKKLVDTATQRHMRLNGRPWVQQSATTTSRCSGSTRWRWPQGSRLRRLHRRVSNAFRVQSRGWLVLRLNESHASLYQLCDFSPPSFEVRKIAVCDKSIRRLSPSVSVACLLDLVEKEKMTVSR